LSKRKPPTQVSESDVDELIADGKRLFEKDDYAAAIEAFSKAIALDDQNAVAYRERARARMFADGYGVRVRACVRDAC